MQPIDQALRKALDSGFAVSFKATADSSDSLRITYTLVCPDGCGYARGIKSADWSDPECEILTGALHVLADSLLKTIDMIPGLEAAKEQHQKAVESFEFSA